MTRQYADINSNIPDLKELKQPYIFCCKRWYADFIKIFISADILMLEQLKEIIKKALDVKKINSQQNAILKWKCYQNLERSLKTLSKSLVSINQLLFALVRMEVSNK